MRDIRFRGRDVVTGNWSFGYYYRSKGNTIIRDELDNECIVIPETVGEYAGTLDKYGFKIFEGDIVKYSFEKYDEYLDETKEHSGVGKIGYSNLYARFTIEPKLNSIDGWISIPDVSEANEHLEIIGNIFSNPELLK